jgi:hypothetical protein
LNKPANRQQPAYRYARKTGVLNHSEIIKTFKIMNFSAIVRKPAALCRFKAGIRSLKPTIFQLMRISLVAIVLLINCISLIQATPTRGQNIATEKVTLGLHQESLEKAIRQLEQHTTFVYYYRKADIKAIANLDLTYESRSIEETLREVLKNTFITFRQVGKNVFIERQNQQSIYEIKGRVVDTARRAVEFATVKLIKKNSGQLTQTTQTTLEGNFSLTAAEKGDYLVSISAMGMDSLTVALSLGDLQSLTLPQIMLSKATTRLKEVVVTSKKPYIEQKMDRTVVNVNSIISNAGANALEALEKSPGVIVDQNGGITFKGKTGVTLLIDDKPTYLSGDNLVNFLRSLQASQLDQIELMTNPPARYEAAGNAGVINIKTKKIKLNGINGSLAVNLGHANFLRTGEGLNLNYRTDKTNWFASAGFNVSKVYNTIDLQRNYFNAGGFMTSMYKEFATLQPKTQNYNLKLGMDYNVSPKTVIGFVLNGSLSNTDRYNPVNSQIFNNSGVLDSTILASNYRTGKFETGGVNFNYGHKFDSLGKALTLDLDYVKYRIKGDDTFLNSSYRADGSPAGSQTITDHLPADIAIYSAKTDYTHPLEGKAKLDAGLKSSYVKTDNAANYFNVVNGASLVDNDRTNRFLYKENINAAYLNFSKEFQRLSVQLGFRAEQTNVQGHQLGNAVIADSSFSQRYLGIFPTAYLLYKLDAAGHHTLNFSFGRRVDRPFYQDLNPFVTIIDKYTYFSGNPFLKPQYTYNYELSYSAGSLFSTTVFYNDYKSFQTETVQERNGVFISSTGNIGQKITMGINATSAFSPAKWWSCNLYTEVVNFQFKGQVYQSGLSKSSTYFYIEGNNQFDLGHDWSAELSGFYIGSRTVGQFDLAAKSQVSAGLQKKVFNNKGVLRLTARDIFLQNFSAGSISNIPGVTSTYKNVSDTRIVTLGFSYNFGSPAKNGKKRNTGSAQSEQNRVKQ